MKYNSFTALLVGSIVFTANAESSVIVQKNLTFELADRLAQSVINDCSKMTYNVTVTVVDRAGIPLVVKRMDNAGPHTLEASRMKAFTSLTTKNTTENLMRNAKSQSYAANMSYLPGFLLLAGGVPVKSGDQVIGAIGVGGAPNGHQDEACAHEGLKSIETELHAG